MNIHRFKRLEALFNAAVGLPDDQRHAYLEKACGDDAELLGLAQRMLRGRGADTEALCPEVEALPTRYRPEPPTSATSPLDPAVPASLLGQGDRVGNYVIREQIGEGGFAVVYAADQEAPVQRRVALKIIKLGMDTRQVIARFEVERQALAMMDHPNVAKVLDAGVTDAGRPYFVMEYVPGISITEHCDRQRLSIDERLGLFMQVCEAVQHAHQKGIIHRDIKPTNVLVMMQDGVAVPKVIDFGVAKAISRRLTEKTVYTEHGQLIGTPEYMSPEQAEMTQQDIDTRSDIYTLGVLLYELLTGSLPFDSTTLRHAAFGEIQRIIREQEPPRPSARLSSLGDASTVSAKRRRAEPRALLRELRGDLDWIVMKALEKDRGRRYDTARGLANDVARHLRNEPVAAGPPGAGYRLRKFVRRHRIGVLASAVTATALLLGSAGVTVGLIRATAAEAEAKSEAEISSAVTGFMIQLFEVADPGEARGNTITAREVLDSGAQRIERELRDQPIVRAALMDAIGRVYQSLGLYPESDLLLQQSLETRRQELGETHVRTIESRTNLAHLRIDQDRYLEARDLLERTLGLVEDPEGADRLLAAWLWYHLAVVHGRLRELAEAQTYFETALPVFEQELGYQSTAVAWCLNDLGNIAIWRLEYETAVRYYERALAIKEHNLGPDHHDVALGMNNLAYVFVHMGQYKKAERLARRSLELMIAILGAEHPNTLPVEDTLGTILLKTGRFQQAEELFRGLVATGERVLGEDHWDLPYYRAHHGMSLVELKRYEEAEPLLLEAYQWVQAAREQARETIVYLVKLYDGWGKPQKAAEWRATLAQQEE